MLQKVLQMKGTHTKEKLVLWAKLKKSNGNGKLLLNIIDYFLLLRSLKYL